LSRNVRAGDTITLRTRFKDDLGKSQQAQNVIVHIYDPDAEEFVPANAVVVSGVATYFGEGIFEYDYAVPSIGPGGAWHDQWIGDLPAQTISGVMAFNVSASGQIFSLPAQLNVNNVVQVTLASGIQAEDGSVLEDEEIFEFMTTTSPAYTNVRKVRLEIGRHIVDLYDDVIQTAILEASLEANVLTFKIGQINTALYEHARREYVSCFSSSILLNNITAGTIRSKTLDNLSVEYDSNTVRDSMNRVRECMARWEGQLIAGGWAKAATNPSYVVKGEMDVDRPDVSRSWESTDSGDISRRYPAANTRVRPTGHRRHLRTYNVNRKKWW